VGEIKPIRVLAACFGICCFRIFAILNISASRPAFLASSLSHNAVFSAFPVPENNKL